ncbi:MAG: DUF423 domain-containing protein [Gammaproteobacteria bacterium]|jgi:uncharacterized membrane protein YgdD (TMEM256/DUF423 family)|nr:DUF423 domain-containing protein [Gammaproteobacteria bacterium]
MCTEPRACRTTSVGRPYVVLGAANGLLAVALGALGAHVLEGHIAVRLMGAFETGAHYHGLHALALVAVGLALNAWDSRWLRVSGAAFTVGILLFSGSLYLMAATGVRWLGAVTPFGGTALIVGWLALAVGAWRGEDDGPRRA